MARAQVTVYRRSDAEKQPVEALEYIDRRHVEFPCSEETGTAEEAVEVEGEAAAGLDAAGMSAREAEVEVDGCVSLACQEASSARAHEATGELARRSAAHRWGRSVGSVTIQY